MKYLLRPVPVKPCPVLVLLLSSLTRLSCTSVCPPRYNHHRGLLSRPVRLLPHPVRLLIRFTSSCGSLSPLSSSPTSPVPLEQSLCCSQTVCFLNFISASSYVLFISLSPMTRSLSRPPRLLPRPVPFATGSSSPVRPPPVRPPPVRPPPVRPPPVRPSPVHPLPVTNLPCATGMVGYESY